MKIKTPPVSDIAFMCKGPENALIIIINSKFGPLFDTKKNYS